MEVLIIAGFFATTNILRYSIRCRDQAVTAASPDYKDFVSEILPTELTIYAGYAMAAALIAIGLVWVAVWKRLG
jgi:hypothetical protein